MQCPKCNINSTGAFCSNCGAQLPNKASYGSGLWQEHYYQGSIHSNQGEIWEYGSGDVKCIEGNPKGSIYQWNGSSFEGKGPFQGTGKWDPSSKKLSWKFSGHSVDFWTYTWEETPQRWKNTSGIQRYEPVTYASFVHWIIKGDVKTGAWSMHIEEGSEKKEGCATEWSVKGDFPPPVAMMIAMHSWSWKLHDEVILRAKRVYKRCNKLVLKNTVTTQVCKNCFTGKNQCIECDREISGQGHTAQMCKACSVKKNFCVRCGDALKNQGTVAFLCDDHGVGKTSNCAKMTFANRPDQ